MKKVGIVTIYDNNNYGNRLQNYALQEYVSSLGFDTMTIQNIPYKDLNNGTFASWLRKVKRFALNLPPIRSQTRNKEIQQWKSHLYGHHDNPVRHEAFSRFNQMIRFYPKVIGYYNMKKLNNQFDFFITGSDQVWNVLLGRGTGLDFLTFADRQKRISYAASISLDAIPDEYRKRFRRYLRGMKAISLRERQASEMVKQDFGVACTSVIDPTMLVERTRWVELAENANASLPENYLLCMFLGDQSDLDAVLEAAKQRHQQVVWLNDPNHPEIYRFGPLEFLYAVRHAGMFLTDSFHGCVFSILFHTPFYVIRRRGEADYMYSRIQSLLDLFGLQSRQWVSGTEMAREEVEASVWEKADVILQEERCKAERFLRTALNLE